MGVVNHNAIIASTWAAARMADLREWIDGLQKTNRAAFIFAPVAINNIYTVVLSPDGSNEFWSESDKGDQLRERFISRLHADNNEDGSSPWCWVEIGYGEYGQKILRGNNKNRYTKTLYCDGGAP